MTIKMHQQLRRLDSASTVTLVITVVLFIIALVEKGFTHDLLLEAGVFLVSAKLVIGNYKANMSIEAINQKLDQLLANKN